MENKEKKGFFGRIYIWFKNLTFKGLLKLVLIIILIIIIVMIVPYLPRLISRASSALSAALYSVFVPAENATMTVDRNIINSGEEFNVQFKNGDITKGLYSVSYACDGNIQLYSVESTGLKQIDCDRRFYLIDNETAITIQAITNTETISRLTLDGLYENNEDQKIDKVGVARITIKNDALNTPVVIPPVTVATSTDTNPPNTYTPPSTYVPPPTYSPPYVGKADLAVRLLQVGSLQGNTIFTRNQFTNQDMIGIRFEVRNDGDAITGPWSFSAILPSVSNPIYTSGTQISLRPGDSIIFTLGFNNLNNQYSNAIIVTADPNNFVSESSKTNNFFTTTIINTGYNTNNNYPNGCYINGVFTYNCTNWNTNPLTVSCYAQPSHPETGERVRWYADVFGGDGDYDYDWEGTNNLNSSSANPSKTYTSAGRKNATVTVTSGAYTATASCSVRVEED